MAKVENEQVVNRFLLSTTYAIVAGLILYFLYVRGLSSLWVNTFYQVLYIGGGIGAIFFGIRKFGLKKGTGYHFCLFLVLAVIGLFLRYGSLVSYFLSGYRRVAFAGVLAAALYVYEIVRYFVCVHKDSVKKKK